MSLVEDIYQSESESESEANEAEHTSPLSPDDGEVEDADADSLGKLTLGTYEEVTHRILSSEDSVEMLQLPLPTLDPLGKVVWQVEFSDIRRRFRKVCSLFCLLLPLHTQQLSRFVHPDKNKSPEAVQAFASNFQVSSILLTFALRAARCCSIFQGSCSKEAASESSCRYELCFNCRATAC